MSVFSVVKYQPLYKSLWNAFVANAKNATFLFQRDFMEYHSDRFEDYSLLIFKDNALFSLLPANRVKNTLHSHQGLTYGGLVWNASAKVLDAFEAYKSLLAHLHEQGFEQLIIKIIPPFYNTLPSDELSYFMYKSDATLLNRDICMVVSLTNRLPFQKNRREGVQRALRNNLTIKEEEKFDAFWNTILIPNLKNRYNAQPVHSLEEIELLAKRFPQNIRQFNVYQENTLVAGVTVFLTKTTVHPQYISADTNRNFSGCIDFLCDYLLTKYQNEKLFFDLATSSIPNSQSLNENLLFWKESSGARAFCADTYAVETKRYDHLELKMKS